jgi:hypothetical protein
MRKLLVSVAIATATLAAVPAAAQYRDHHPGWNQRGPSRPAVNNLLRQLDNVDVRITRSMQRRVISQREAVSLRRESNQIRSRLRIAARNGLSGREFAALQVRVNQLEQRLRYERRDRDGRRG